jgi:hypothetical protein
LRGAVEVCRGAYIHENSPARKGVNDEETGARGSMKEGCVRGREGASSTPESGLVAVGDIDAH